MEPLKLPPIDYGALLPMLILFGAACAGVLVEVVLPRRLRNVVQLTLALLAVDTFKISYIHFIHPFRCRVKFCI